MKFTLTVDGSDPVILADHGRDGVCGFVPTIIYNDDLLLFVQGIYAKPKDRGNISHQHTFSVSQEHASLSDAQRFVLLIGQNTPRVGTLDIELEDTVTHLVALEAVCRVQPLPCVGRMSTVSYTLKFGAISTVYTFVPLLTSDGKNVLDANGKTKLVRKEIA